MGWISAIFINVQDILRQDIVINTLQQSDFLF
jgi:hypothetical protein